MFRDDKSVVQASQGGSKVQGKKECEGACAWLFPQKDDGENNDSSYIKLSPQETL